MPVNDNDSTIGSIALNRPLEHFARDTNRRVHYLTRIVYDFPPFGGPKDDPQIYPKGGSASQSIKQISEDFKAYFGEGEKRVKKTTRFTSIESSIYPHYKKIERRPFFYRSGYICFLNREVQIGDEKKKRR